MIILAIDTACDSMSCAVAADGVVLSEIYMHVGHKHSVTLMPSLAQLLKGAGIQKCELDAVAVINGPGSFTGIRIGVATASALAYALAIPVYAVSTLDALIAGAGSNGTVCAILDARRGEVYVKAVTDSGVVIPEGAMPLTDVVTKLGPESSPLFMGDAAVRFQNQIRTALPDARFLPEGMSYPHAQYALDAIQMGWSHVCTHDTLKASYLRPSQAERMKGACL